MAKTRKIVIGTCKLCLAEGVRLQASHFLSKGIYKSLRINTGKTNLNPMVITPKGVVQTSMQGCEGRIGKNGEDWVMRNGLKNDGKFKLLSTLHQHPFQLDASQTAAIFRAARIPEVNVSALTYFAASIFWRGSIHPWKTDETQPVPLGPYEESLRQYLLGEADFPRDMTLSTTVRIPSPISHITYEPMGEWRGLLFVAKFPMPGLAFGIAAGPEIPAPLREMCFVRGDGNPLFLSGELEKYLLEDGAKMLERIPLQNRPTNLDHYCDPPRSASLTKTNPTLAPQ
jgi:hypothetical protein